MAEIGQTEIPTPFRKPPARAGVPDIDLNAPGPAALPRPAGPRPQTKLYELPESYANESHPTESPFGKPVDYLDAEARKQYLVHVNEKGLLCRADGSILDTRKAGELAQGRSLFVMDPEGNMYCATGARSADKLFQHSSFLAGGAVRTAGELKVVDGVVEQISNGSGHYRPEPASLQHVVDFLENGGADTGRATFEYW